MGILQCRLNIFMTIFVILIIYCILIVTIKIVHYAKLDMTGIKIVEQKSDGHLENNNVKIDKLLLDIVKQRNTLSQQLNIKQQRLTRLQCKESNTSSETGGWCNEQSKAMGGKHMTDTDLVPTLIQFLKGKYIASFGDGPGTYRDLFIKSGKVKDYDAYDGAPFCDVTSNGRVRFLDLSLPQYGLPLYDWVISLEVAEHIPRRFENTFVDNIVRHAREGVILSWAKLLQGGYLHVNNRPIEHVITLMNSKGFFHDEFASNKLQAAASFRFFKTNINVFRRRKALPHNTLMLNA